MAWEYLLKPKTPSLEPYYRLRDRLSALNFRSGSLWFQLVTETLAIPSPGILHCAHAATRDMAISLVPVALGNLGMLPNATVYPPDPQFFKSERTLGIHLGQPDHRSPYAVEAFVQPAGIPKVGLAQHNADHSTISSFVTVSSWSLIPRDLFETKDLTPAFFRPPGQAPFQRPRNRPSFSRPEGSRPSVSFGRSGPLVPHPKVLPWPSSPLLSRHRTVRPSPITF